MSDEKKIIIDEDWKAQVQAEKEQAAASNQEPPTKDATAAEGQAADPPMPPASFEVLLTTLATEALVALGQVPHPVTGEVHAHRNQAKYLIDTIEVLRDKTRGNLTTDEQQLVESLLHQLRMVFIAAQSTS